MTDSATFAIRLKQPGTPSSGLNPIKTTEEKMVAALSSEKRTVQTIFIKSALFQLLPICFRHFHSQTKNFFQLILQLFCEP
jgi:hypothetical protein